MDVTPCCCGGVSLWFVRLVAFVLWNWLPLSVACIYLEYPFHNKECSHNQYVVTLFLSFGYFCLHV